MLISPHFNLVLKMLCKCKLEAKRIQVKKDGVNKGRYFFACPQQKAKQCDFFEWETRIPTHQASMTQEQYENLMLAIRTINENLKAISARLFKEGYIPVVDSKPEIKEDMVDLDQVQF